VPDAVAVGQSTATELGRRDVAEAIAFARQLHPTVLAQTGKTSLPDDGNGFVLDSLSLAVAAVLDPRPLPDVLIDIVRLGNDADTNAAIAGGLLGARDGINAIPDPWLSALQFRTEFLRAAETLAS
jgi:ADP-ribosylglycohydrolase